jgi:TusA-related sulfurtransferase
MAKVILDTIGMSCPQVISKIALKALDMKPGDILEVLGDGPCFEDDIRILCKRTRRNFHPIKHEDHHEKRIQIQF